MNETPIYDAVSRDMALAIEAGNLKGRILALQNVAAEIDAIPNEQFTRANITAAINKTLANYRQLKTVNTRKQRKTKNV